MDTTTRATAPAPGLLRTVRRVLLRNLLWAGLVTAAWLVTTLGPAAGTLARPSGVEQPSPAEVLIARYDCWTGEAPAGTDPTRAVVTLPGGEPRLVRAEVGFGMWLDGDPGTLHAFCP